MILAMLGFIISIVFLALMLSPILLILYVLYIFIFPDHFNKYFNPANPDRVYK